MGEAKNGGTGRVSADAVSTEKQSPLSVLKSHSRWLIPVGIFLVCLAVYSCVHMSLTNKEDIFTTYGDEMNYLVLTESIIEDRDLSPINNYLNRSYMKQGYFEEELDFPNQWDTSILMLVPGHEGRMAYTHLPMLSLLLVPGFYLFGYHGAAFTMILFTCLSAVFIFLILRRITRETTALFATLAFYLTYPLIMYSKLIYPATAIILFLPLALWSSLRLKESGKWGYALMAGIVTGVILQLHVKYATIVIALLFLVWVCAPRRKRDMLVWLAPVAVSFVLLISITLYLYGPNLRHGLTVSSGAGGFFHPSPFWGMFGLYLDRTLGLFIFAPLYLAFAPGVPLPRKRKDLGKWWVFIPLCIFLHTVMAGISGKWSGDVSSVPRQLMPVIPLLIICAAVFYDNLRSKPVKFFVGALLAFQITLTVFALMDTVGTFAIHGNRILPRVLGNTWLYRLVFRVFPLLYHAEFKSVILFLGWLTVLVGASVYLRKRSMSSIYQGLEYV